MSSCPWLHKPRPPEQQTVTPSPKDLEPDSVQLFFKVADGTEVVGKVAIGNRLFPDFNRAYFQHSMVAMW
jgi:hypothetical protein